MTSHEPEAGPLRGRAREAQSNDGAILRAAREVFSEWGWSAPMSEVAARANTGVASIYRRYPSKTELVNAIRVYALDLICELAEDCAGKAGQPGQPESAVELFLRRHIAEARGPLMPLLGRQVGSNDEIDALSDRLEVALAAIIAHDVARGLVPASYGPGDLMLTVTHLRPALTVPRERANVIHLRQLDYVLAGLRAYAETGDEPSGQSSSWAEWVSLNNTDERE
ncbi:TetR/AcrR family transcriptional regulator [Leucobacter aridicollis]|uniref:AcrR family transcriptional regulator n=1 Tax=Leucobacter aridicollis TaxID=283878 RepID=A0A852R644_9MICO|nr:TetR/AcrR family transcriptional regulator [Leucobacter aridicollis]NYD25929.1 AcrR family transcriptional regulator [Leucobacter aridicollis]